jgi:hypothetical protein
MAVASQWPLNTQRIPEQSLGNGQAVSDAIIEELLETMFSTRSATFYIRSVLRLYKEDQRSKRADLGPAVCQRLRDRSQPERTEAASHRR